jgi:hypothetical protein
VTAIAKLIGFVAGFVLALAQDISNAERVAHDIFED